MTPNDRAEGILAADMVARLRKFSAEMQNDGVALYCPLLLEAAAAMIERLAPKQEAEAQRRRG